MEENWSVIAVIFVDIFMFLLMTFVRIIHRNFHGVCTSNKTYCNVFNVCKHAIAV